jgi:hypothetical protein
MKNKDNTVKTFIPVYRNSKNTYIPLIFDKYNKEYNTPSTRNMLLYNGFFTKRDKPYSGTDLNQYMDRYPYFSTPSEGSNNDITAWTAQDCIAYARTIDSHSYYVTSAINSTLINDFTKKYFDSKKCQVTGGGTGTLGPQRTIYTA